VKDWGQVAAYCVENDEEREKRKVNYLPYLQARDDLYGCLGLSDACGCSSE